MKEPWSTLRVTGRIDDGRSTIAWLLGGIVGRFWDTCTAFLRSSSAVFLRYQEDAQVNIFARSALVKCRALPQTSHNHHSSALERQCTHRELHNETHRATSVLIFQWLKCQFHARDRCAAATSVKQTVSIDIPTGTKKPIVVQNPPPSRLKYCKATIHMHKYKHTCYILSHYDSICSDSLNGKNEDTPANNHTVQHR